MTKVRCCSRHRENVQLIFTFAFPGAEYWCPFCGANEGMMGAGEIRDLTFSERRDMIKYREIGTYFLDARSTLVCESLIFNGKRVKPQDLPKKEIQRVKKIVSEWVYPIDLKK